jgi:thioredoxin reductase (NADPH)
MREQAEKFGVQITHAVVERLDHHGDTFSARVGDDAIAARSVLLATGVVNNRPRMDDADHDAALAQGLIRYCPICDGFEVTDRKVPVIGSQTHGYNEAVFLRMYTSDVTLIAPDGALSLTAAERHHLIELGVALHDGPCGPLEFRARFMLVRLPEKALVFDAIYPALGSVLRSECAVAVGAKATKEGRRVVDDHQRTTIPGLYAAGDVAKGLDQISHAMGEAGVAATTIRNDLAKIAPLLRASRPKRSHCDR